MPAGVLSGGEEFVAAAYIVSFAVLSLFSIPMIWRARQEGVL